MEAAWHNIAHAAVQSSLSTAAFSKNAAEEKYATKREVEFVSMLASNLSKVSIFRDWQTDQLEGLVPMASVHSIISECVNEIGFEEPHATNIVLVKLKSKQFDVHREICYPEYVRRIKLKKRTILIVLDGEMNVRSKNCNKHLMKSNCMLLSPCDEIESAASTSGEFIDSNTRFRDSSSLQFGDISYTSHHVFFMLLSEAAVESVASTTIMSSKVEFSLHGDSAIRSQAITLDAMCRAKKCETKVFYPGEVCSAGKADRKFSMIVSGNCVQKQGEDLAARFKDTCNSRQIAQSEEPSLSQAIFFAIRQKRAVRKACMKLKPKFNNITVKRHPGAHVDPSQDAHVQHEFFIPGNGDGIAAQVTQMLLEISPGNRKHNIPATNYRANAERTVGNPFMMALPAFRDDDAEGALPRSPAVRKKESKFASINESTASSPEPVFPSVDKIDTVSCDQITKNTAFWGYTPALQKPLSNAKFYWALIRIFVHSCTKKVRNVLRKGESLDVSHLCDFQGHGGKSRISHTFLTLSVVYTIPCDQAVTIFNPCLHAISRVASWHNDLCCKPYFRNAENIEKIQAGTRNLKCFSKIPQSTLKHIFANCLFEEWPPGTLILSTVSSEQRMCFMIDGDAAAFPTLQKDEQDAIDEIRRGDNIANHYVAGDVLSQQNIIQSYTNEPRKNEHVYAGLKGAKVLSVPQAIQTKLLKPLWDEELKSKMKCFQKSQLSAGFSEGTLLKVLSQSRIVEIFDHQAPLNFSVTSIYLVLEGFVRVSGSASVSLNHKIGKVMMKHNFSQQNGTISMVDSLSAPSKLEERLKRKLAASPKQSQSQLKFHVVDMHSPHLFRVCSHDSDQKCPLAKCWKFANYSCPSNTKVIEVQLQHLPQKMFPDILKAINLAHTRLWNFYLQIKSFAVPHLDTSSGHATISLESGKKAFQCKALVKTRIDKLAVPLERFQVAQKACDFTIYSQQDPYQEVLNTAAELKALQAARSKLSTIESLKLNRLSGPSPDLSGSHNPGSLSKPLELNSFLYDAAAVASPCMIHKEQTELRSISSQPRTSSLKLWNKGLAQMALSVVEPSKRVLFLADKETGFSKMTPQEESEFEEFCSVLKEKSQNPDIRDSRERRKFLATFGDGLVRSQAFVKTTWCFDLQ